MIQSFAVLMARAEKEGKFKLISSDSAICLRRQLFQFSFRLVFLSRCDKRTDKRSSHSLQQNSFNNFKLRRVGAHFEAQLKLFLIVQGTRLLLSSDGEKAEKAQQQNRRERKTK